MMLEDDVVSSEVAVSDSTTTTTANGAPLPSGRRSNTDAPIPSARTRGKRPAVAPDAEKKSAASMRQDTGTMTPPTVSATAGTAGSPAAAAFTPTGKSGSQASQTRQKRILPSRSRRGGPGVGGCDVDIMILETRRRRLENEPLIPATTKFVLTTDSTLIPPLPSSRSSENEEEGSQLNEYAYGRYFDRPEVQKAYKEQQLIQTPEFTQLSDDATVGGRFRPRSEEESADTSDAAYEKRHRKYESFEKRQRLREKEKLKHEHYKLKERIEQLRGMDYSAFLALPSSALADPSDHLAYNANLDATSSADAGVVDLPGAHVNGAAAYNEGERRRKEMLDVALSLEERYKVLLPPDRKWSEKKEKEKVPRKESLPAHVTHIQTYVENGDMAEVTHTPRPPSRKSETRSPVKEKEKEVVVVTQLQPQTQTQLPPQPDSDGEPEVDPDERERLRSKQLKLRIKFPPRPPPPAPVDPVKFGPSPSPSKKISSPLATLTTPLSPSILDSISPMQVKNISAKSGIIIRAKDGKFLPKHKRYIQDPVLFNGSEPISAPPLLPSTSTAAAAAAVPTPPPPRKRQRTESPSVSTITKQSSNAPGTSTRGPDRSTCVLMIYALRNSLLPNSRKTQRHVLAFGTRVPSEIEEVRDFEIPTWVNAPIKEEEEDGEAGGGGHGDEVLEHGSAYEFSASTNGNGVARSSEVQSASAVEVEEVASEEKMGSADPSAGDSAGMRKVVGGYLNGTGAKQEEQDVDELMDWQSTGEGDQLLDSRDDIPPIATLDDDGDVEAGRLSM